MPYLSQPFVPVPLYTSTTPQEIQLAKNNGVIDRNFALYASPQHWISITGYTAPAQGDTGKYWADPYVYGDEPVPYVVLDHANPIVTSDPNWASHPAWEHYGFHFFNYVSQFKSQFPKVPGLKVVYYHPDEARRLNLHKPNMSQVPFAKGTQFRSDLGLRFDANFNKVEAFEFQGW